MSILLTQTCENNNNGSYKILCHDLVPGVNTKQEKDISYEINV